MATQSMLFSGERHFASTTFFSDLTAFSALLCHGFNFTSALAGPAKTAAINPIILIVAAIVAAAVAIYICWEPIKAFFAGVWNAIASGASAAWATLNITGERVETPAHAKALARSRMHFKNRKRRSGSISLIGDVRALAGVVVDMTDFGKYSGRYLIDRSTHDMSRSGYTTEAELVDARK